MRIETLDVGFKGKDGQGLVGRLERPEGLKPRAAALFAHCFTCAKDSVAAVRVSRALAAEGFAVLRFDFTGLGHSGGEFADTTFSGNVDDLLAAAAYLAEAHAPPLLLIGHSLGGAAVLAAAPRLPAARAVVTIGAPADPAHVTHLLGDQVAVIERDGKADVQIGGRPFALRKSFLDDLRAQDLETTLKGLKKALLVMHSPTDATVGIENATRLFAAAKHPKSFVGLDGADHLLTKRADARFVADVIAGWVRRYLDAEPPMPHAALEGEVVVEETGEGKFQQSIVVGDHQLFADEPTDIGGADTGPTPYDLLLAGLGACTAMTVRLYADRKQWPLEGIAVALKHDKIHAADCADCETKEGKIDQIERTIRLKGPLDQGQRAKLLEIADKCPVHRTLHSEVQIVTGEG